MAKSPCRIAAMAELSRSPLNQPADITVEPPSSGYMRIRLSLSGLTPPGATVAIDITPTRSEAGHVSINQ